ncbi:MAG: SdpI family protein [Clostridiaceae bacterium]
MYNSLIVGGVVFAYGFITFLAKPKKINNWFGYRSETSRLSPESWKAGNRYNANMYLIAGALLMVIGKAGDYMSGQGFKFALIALIPVLCVTVFTTEKYLKRNFDRNGYRIEK